MEKYLQNKKLVIYGVSGILFIGLCIILFCDRKVTCTFESKQDNHVINAKYIIKYKNGYVKKVKINQIVTTDEKSIIDKYNKQFEKQYSSNKKYYGGYDYKITIKDDSISSNVVINYKKFDMNKFIKNNEAMKQYTKDGKFTIEGAKKMYEASGAICK